MAPKIAIIGAGSAAFSLELITNICLTPNLRGSTISFMDIDPGRLDTAYTLGRRYAEEVGAELQLEKTTDRRQALRDADFVVNTALVINHHRLAEGWRIAQRLGYNWGGSFHVMYDEPFWVNYYQFRLFGSLMEDALELCPQAWHLLVANPVLAGVTYIGRKYPQAKVAGLCHGFAHVYGIAEALGLDRDSITYEIPGVNHFVWLTQFRHKGEDAFAVLDRWIEEDLPRLEKEGKAHHALSLKSIDLYKRFGAFPIGDTATATGASWPVWYHSDEATERRWRQGPGKDFWWDYPTQASREAEEMQRAAADPAIRVSERFASHSVDPLIVPFIESIACDVPRVLVGNILNSGGLVPGIPSDFEVEIPLLVSKRGVQGIQTHGLPRALLAHTLRDRVAPVNLEIEAHETGSRELLRQLIMMDPWSRTEEQAGRLIDEVMALPYHEELRRHYR